MHDDPAGMDRALEFIAQDPPTREEGLEGLRRWIDGLGRGATMPGSVTQARERIGAVPCLRYSPRQVLSAGAIVYLHGGAYVAGSHRSHGPLAAMLAEAAGMDVVFPEYRLAPEHPFPAALDDARAVYGALASGGRKIAVAGDSAGGGLALSLARTLIDAGMTAPRCLAVLSPWVDLALSAPVARDPDADDPLLTVEALTVSASLYSGDRALAHPAISPLYMDMSGMPPVQVMVGERERLIADARAIAARLEADGAAVDFREWPGMIHVWPLFARFLPEGGQAIAAMGGFIRAHMPAR